MGDFRRELHVPSADTDREHRVAAQQAVARVVAHRYAMGLPATAALELLDMLGLTDTATEMACKAAQQPAGGTNTAAPVVKLHAEDSRSDSPTSEVAS